jgi:pimeloyl-ACP methyl ester carboxylesterase
MNASGGGQLPFFENLSGAGGEAPWLTLVHGASQDRRVFSAQIPVFDQNYRLLLVDLPGHGGSAALPGPYGFEEHALSVLAAMDEAGVGVTHYWGTHTGAAAGLLLASRHPERIASLVLEGAVIPGVDLAAVAEALERARASARENGIEAARSEWFERSEWFRVIRENPVTCRADAHRAMIANFTGGPWLDASAPRTLPSLVADLPSIRQPVLLINGEHDLPDFVRMADELEQHLPNSQRARIAGAGGFPLWEFPDRVNERVWRFLEDLSSVL